LAVILGEDELAAGKVRIKQMGLEDGHPEKEGVLVELKSLSTEVRQRLDVIYKDGVDGELAGKVGELKTEDAGV
jgi:histidyl-tRNA synthetase